MDGSSSKLPFEQVEKRARPFLEGVIPSNLDRLSKHKEALKQHSSEERWTLLHKEQVMAHTTVQQLKSNMEYLEQCYTLIKSEEAFRYQELINPIQKRVSREIESFGVVTASLTGNREDSHEMSLEFQSLTLEDKLSLIPSSEDAYQSWERLRTDMKELQGLVVNFNRIVNLQEEKIATINDHITAAENNIEEGRRQLGKASFLKAAMLPLAGALVGGALGLAVGGPVGLVVGSKVALIAVTTGGLAAGTGVGLAAKEIKKRNALQDEKKRQ